MQITEFVLSSLDELIIFLATVVTVVTFLRLLKEWGVIDFVVSKHLHNLVGAVVALFLSLFCYETQLVLCDGGFCGTNVVFTLAVSKYVFGALSIFLIFKYVVEAFFPDIF